MGPPKKMLKGSQDIIKPTVDTPYVVWGAPSQRRIG